MAKTRVIGLDIYRLIAIVLITNLHYFGYSHIAASPSLTAYNRFFVQLVNCFNSCFVDMFVLLTGYFLGQRTTKNMRLVDLWFQALVVGLIMLVVCGILSPKLITLKAIVHTFFPISTFTYWYLIPYGMLFLLIPCINRLLDMMERRNLLRTILIWGGVMCLFELSPILSLDWFIGNYMSIVWFLYIYVLGAYINRYGFPPMVVWMVIGVISLVMMLLIRVFGIHFPKEMRLTSFCSPLPLFVSFFFLYLMSKIKSLGGTLDAIIGSLSMSSLCVYLVQEQYSFREYFWSAIQITNYVDSPYLILHWLLSLAILFALGWITYQCYIIIYYKCLHPYVVIPVVKRIEAVLMRKHRDVL